MKKLQKLRLRALKLQRLQLKALRLLNLKVNPKPVVLLVSGVGFWVYVYPAIMDAQAVQAPQRIAILVGVDTT